MYIFAEGIGIVIFSCYSSLLYKNRGFSTRFGGIPSTSSGGKPPYFYYPPVVFLFFFTNSKIVLDYISADILFIEISDMVIIRMDSLFEFLYDYSRPGGKLAITYNIISQANEYTVVQGKVEKYYNSIGLEEVETIDISINGSVHDNNEMEVDSGGLSLSIAPNVSNTTSRRLGPGTVYLAQVLVIKKLLIVIEDTATRFPISDTDIDKDKIPIFFG
jgi:hypothetical protein